MPPDPLSYNMSDVNPHLTQSEPPPYLKAGSAPVSSTLCCFFTFQKVATFSIPVLGIPITGQARLKAVLGWKVTSGVIIRNKNVFSVWILVIVLAKSVNTKKYQVALF